MANAIFVSETWLKNNTAISGNLDILELLPFVQEAQDQYVQDLTGSSLYETLKTAVVGASLSADQTALMNLIRPALAWYSVYKALPFLNWKLKAKAVLRGNGEGVEPAALDEIRYLREEVKQNAQFHSQRVVDYLAKNCSKFPDYSAPGTSDIYPSGSAYRLGIGLDRNDMTEADRDFMRRYLL
jgi:hypothetical protein